MAPEGELRHPRCSQQSCCYRRVEEWWAGKDKWKRSYTGAHYTGTEYHLPDGYAHEGSPWTEVPWPESLLAEKVLAPLGQVDAPQRISDATHTSHTVAQVPLAIHPVGLTKPPLSCVLPASQHGEVSLTDPRDYCFEPGTTELRVSILTGLLSAYNKLAKFQEHTISLESSMSVNHHGLLNVHVVGLTGLSSIDEKIFTPAAPLVHSNASLAIPGAVLAGKKISGADPIYPEAAKFHRDQGVVIVGATINQQGHIENARVLEAPTSELGASSLAAIRTWVYQPYLLNGQPVSVETTVNVIFAMGN